MRKSEMQVGETYQDNLSRVLRFERFVENSHTKAIVTDVTPDRPRSWLTKSKEGEITGGGWCLGKNYQFGHEDIVHIKELTRCEV